MPQHYTFEISVVYKLGRELHRDITGNIMNKKVIFRLKAKQPRLLLDQET